jgi:hypothetical protein
MNIDGFDVAGDRRWKRNGGAGCTWPIRIKICQPGLIRGVADDLSLAR